MMRAGIGLWVWSLVATAVAATAAAPERVTVDTFAGAETDNYFAKFLYRPRRELIDGTWKLPEAEV